MIDDPVKRIRSRPEVHKMADDLIKAQEAEVASLQQWLKQRGGQ